MRAHISKFEVCFAAVALGMVNATAMVVHGYITQALTFNVQKCVMALMDIFFGVGDAPDATRRRTVLGEGDGPK